VKRNTRPASFQDPTAVAGQKAHQQTPFGDMYQASVGIGNMFLDANGEQYSNYSNPNGTVFVCEGDGTWADHVFDTVSHGVTND
jgi:hypothetical protein